METEFDYLFKLLMIGDSGVGKSSVLLSFTSDTFEELFPHRNQVYAGVDFKVKYVNAGDKKLKLAIWDTARQERFRTLTSSYYRGAQGVVMGFSNETLYDVTRRDTFTNLSEVWAKEFEIYSTNQDCIKMLVVNKVDKVKDKYGASCYISVLALGHYEKELLNSSPDAGTWMIWEEKDFGLDEYSIMIQDAVWEKLNYRIFHYQEEAHLTSTMDFIKLGQISTHKQYSWFLSANLAYACATVLTSH